jgi:SAM-dependent methyltransferase
MAGWLARVKGDAFNPGWTAAFSSPVYLIRQALAHSIAEFAANVRGDVLDFGCGSKPYESWFVHSTSYTGVDLNVSGHDHSSSKIDYFYDGRRLPFADAQFDAVVAFEVFEHVPNLQEVLIELRRVLRKPGRLLISIPFLWPEHEQPFDHARYTTFGITALLRQSGFSVLELRKANPGSAAIIQLLAFRIHQHFEGCNLLVRGFVQLCFICPLTLLAIALRAFVKGDTDLFSNCVVLSEAR